MLGDGPGRCLYCLHNPDAEGAAAEFVTTILHQPSYYETVKDGGEWLVNQCVECGTQAFVATADQGGDACGQSCLDRAVGHCRDCGIMTYREADSLAVCDNCVEDFMAD